MTIRVEIFSSPGCNRCRQARQVLRKLVEEMGGGRITWRGVDVLDEMEYTVSVGVLSTPAIAIDGELVFTGLPSPARLRAELERRLAGSR